MNIAGIRAAELTLGAVGILEAEPEAMSNRTVTIRLGYLPRLQPAEAIEDEATACLGRRLEPRGGQRSRREP